MEWLNHHHTLYYFWLAAREGSITICLANVNRRFFYTTERASKFRRKVPSSLTVALLLMSGEQTAVRRELQQ